MKKIIPCLIVFLIAGSCYEDESSLPEDPENNLCLARQEVLSVPEGFSLSTVHCFEDGFRPSKMNFVNSQVGYLLGNKDNRSHFLRTNDGGLSWTNLAPPAENNLKDILFIDENVGYYSYADPTTIYTTMDAGQSWEEMQVDIVENFITKLKVDQEGNLYGVSKINNEEAVIIQYNIGDQIWRILNEEAKVSSRSGNFQYSIFEDHIYAMGLGDFLLVMSPTAEVVDTIFTPHSSFNQITVMTSNDMVLAGSSSPHRTNNRGESWEKIYDNISKIIHFDSLGNGLMVLTKSFCFQNGFNNDVIAFLASGETDWVEGDFVTYLRLDLKDSHAFGANEHLIIVSECIHKISR